jgi:glycosyltransferase involved in cell wall biosynthesis
MYSKKLSIIIPAYKESKTIGANLEWIRKKLAGVISDYEIIVVIDGKVDDTYSKVKKVAKKVGGIKIVSYEKNHGKGFALKRGFAASTGELIMFLDADGDIDPLQLKRLYPYMSAADLVIGSKRHPFSKTHYPFIRKVLSFCYSVFIRIFFGLKLRDTQTGIKLMKREMLKVVMPFILVKRYAFDLELCFLASKHGFRIVEAPIEINYKFSGSGIDAKAVRNIFVDTLAIWYRYHILRYYQKKYYQAKK